VDDTTITAKVKSKLVEDEDIKSTQIEVKTVFGHVVLLGIVGSHRERDKAIAHAKSVEYVKKVKSFITIW
jgi:hyperosmotically inducible protein